MQKHLIVEYSQFANNKSFAIYSTVLFCKRVVCVLISHENDLLDSAISDKNIDWGYKHSYPWCQSLVLWPSIIILAGEN